MSDAPALERLVGGFLRAGTVASALAIATGLVLGFFEGPHAQNPVPASPAELWVGLTALHPVAFDVAGIVILLATPVLRVAIAACGFLWRKEYAIAAFSLGAIAVMALSFLLGAAHP